MANQLRDCTTTGASRGTLSDSSVARDAGMTVRCTSVPSGTT
jgi:hypothetical protein